MQTGKVEQHTINDKQPIYGMKEEVQTVVKSDTRRYDLVQKQYSPVISTITQA